MISQLEKRIEDLAEIVDALSLAVDELCFKLEQEDQLPELEVFEED